MESPSEAEVADIVKRYKLHPLVGEELQRANSMARVDFYDDYIVMVLTLPVRIKKGKNYEIVDRELDFVIGKHFLITSRYDTIEQLEYFGKVFEANSILNQDEKLDHAGFLFYYIMKKIYKGMVEDLKNIEDALAYTEKKIYKGDEREMVEVLSNLSHELIDIKQIARMHHDIWEKMVIKEEKILFGKDFATYIKDIRDQFNVIHEHIINSRELLNDLRETNDSLLNTKQNEIIKILTTISIIFGPLTFIAAVFTIPASYVPLIRNPNGWSIIVLVMAFIMFMIWYIFKKRRWI